MHAGVMPAADSSSSRSRPRPAPRSRLLRQLLLAHPQRVEAVRHAARQAHARQRLLRHGGRVVHVERAAVGAAVVHIHQQPAVVLCALGGVGVAGHVVRLASVAALREADVAHARVLGTLPAALSMTQQVVLGDALRLHRDGLVVKRGAPRPAAAVAHEARVHHGEVGVGRRQLRGRGLARGRVQHVLGEALALGLGRRRARLLGAARLDVHRVKVEGELGEGAREHVHAAVAVLPRVGHVEHVLRGQLEPGDGRGGRLGVQHAHARRQAGRIAAQQADARGAVLHERQRQAVALHHGLAVEAQRHVQQHRVVLRDGAVVHHGRPGRVHRPLPEQRAALVHQPRAHVRPGVKRVAEEKHLACARVHLGVRGEGRGERGRLGRRRPGAAHLQPPQRVNHAVARHAHGVRQVALVQRQQAARVEHERGVGGARPALARADAQLALERVQQQDEQAALAHDVPHLHVQRAPRLALHREARGAHLVVGVPHRAPAPEPHAVQHAVAVKPVVAAHGVQRGVGPGAHVRAAQVGGQGAFDFQLAGRDLVAHRAKVAGQVVGARVGGPAVAARHRVKQHAHQPLGCMEQHHASCSDGSQRNHNLAYWTCLVKYLMH
mmetsp:Transcript_29049/g.74120  ORF Transcript_29049/g.74120 Transcript_29049/m.74120 type:complete len:609 (-) Transcript_29049:118-1944(-)